jgi:hypothetical protein
MEDTRNKAFGVKPPIPIPPTFTGEGGVWSDDFVFDMRCIDKNLAGEIWISFLKEHDPWKKQELVNLTIQTRLRLSACYSQE